MNKELLEHMQKQMSPSPEVRAALDEKLAQTAKKRPVPWKKYTALAACAALVIGAYAVYQTGKPRYLILYSHIPLHSYVTVEGPAGYIAENAAAFDAGSGGEDAPNTGDLPGGADVGDVPVQEEAATAYQKLVPHIKSHPDWYGGAYIDGTGTLIVCLVEREDPGDKSLELQVLDWTDNGKVGFTSGKYSLGYLLDLQTKVCDALYYDLGLDFGCGTDEEHNRLNLTLSEATDAALALLAELDPDGDAIYVQVGQRASFEDAFGEDVTTDSATTEDPAVYHVLPRALDGPVPGGEDPIADEPVYDGAHYDLEELPEEKQPAFEVQR